MNKRVVFFDGVCGFCNRYVDFLWNLDCERKFHYASLQSDFARRQLGDVGFQTLDLDSIYYQDDIGVYKKSRAIFSILIAVGGGWGFFGKVGSVLPRTVTDWAYDIVAHNRYLLSGRSDTCRLPSEEEREYFLD